MSKIKPEQLGRIRALMTNGNGAFSKTAFWFWIVSFISVVVPLALIFTGSVTGADWLDYMKISVPSFLASYGISKKIDGDMRK